MLTAAYSGPLTIARAIHELVLPQLDDSDTSRSLPEKKEKFSGQSKRKGPPHHHSPRLPAPSAVRRQVEVHVLGAASQEETLLPTYYPEIGLLFPELSVRITMVGPELSPKTIFSENLSLGDNITATLKRDDYAAFRRNSRARKSFREADLLVAFNPGGFLLK